MKNRKTYGHNNRTAGGSFNERNVHFRDINININYAARDANDASAHDVGYEVRTSIEQALAVISDGVEEERILGVEEELMPLFYNNREEMQKFLAAISNARPQDITSMVCGLVERHVISDMSCKGPLWHILNRHGLYNNSKRTWNKQVNW